jgi:hypothetical protein
LAFTLPSPAGPWASEALNLELARTRTAPAP